MNQEQKDRIDLVKARAKERYIKLQEKLDIYTWNFRIESSLENMNLKDFMLGARERLNPFVCDGKRTFSPSDVAKDSLRILQSLEFQFQSTKESMQDSFESMLMIIEDLEKYIEDLEAKLNPVVEKQVVAEEKSEEEELPLQEIEEVEDVSFETETSAPHPFEDYEMELYQEALEVVPKYDQKDIQEIEIKRYMDTIKKGEKWRK